MPYGGSTWFELLCHVGANINEREEHAHNEAGPKKLQSSVL